jgi:cytochrome c oxidase subunit 3
MREENEPLQKARYLQGMWVFLGSEILFFSGIFLGLVVYRHLYPEAFVEGSRKTTLWMGAVNTFLLLASSWLIAEYLEKRREARQTGARMPGHARLWIAGFLGCGFLILKFWEYSEHIRAGLFPGSHWHAASSVHAQLPLFFFLYFFVTGLHALHLLIGLVVLLILMGRKVSEKKMDLLWENFGLYWHFVDIIWVFLFTFFYLGAPR